ncbi:MAG: SIS domain-containing protein [Candidatus Micrarchaeia archaeon]|jgi:D-sedoheptulose 7-phosphate isomerase
MIDAKKFEKDLAEYFEKISFVARDMQGSVEKIAKMAILLEEAAEKGHNIYIMGNGGSASTASHMASDLNKTAIAQGRKRFKAICLNDNIPVMLAWANDNSFDLIFVEQLKNFLSEGDIVIGISGSGNSPNVIKAIEYANQEGNMTIGITGMINPNGGKLGTIAKLPIIVPDNLMYRLEDFHLMINHALIFALKHSAEKE